MIKFISFSFYFLVWTSIYGQIQGISGEPLSSRYDLVIPNEKISFQKPDIKALRAEDALNDAKGDGPWRFGYTNDVNLDMLNSGNWTELPDGGQLWRLLIECEEALTVNLTLKDVTLPEGNELYVYNPDKSVVLGKFTDFHLYKGKLGTELVTGSEIVIEYYLAPGNALAFSTLTVERATHGYRTDEEFMAKTFGQAGACNMNVNCPDGDEWENQKRSVVMIVNGVGNGFCTGALVNNTLNDGKPYILTANHCFSDPTVWVFRFNWQSPDCENPATSPTFSSLSGGEFRARRTGSDFCLVEIAGGLEAGTVPASYNAFFSGWDNTGANPSSTVCIHHPRGDIKKISFDDNPSYPVQSSISGTTSDVDGSWAVKWDRNTTTEAASSGSPLFDQNHRIIGQLWGGAASCTNPEGKDFYGRFSISWNPPGSVSANQLKHWLDPTDIGAIVIDGYDPAGSQAVIDAALVVPAGVNETYCLAATSPQITLVNMGTTLLTSATISYGFDGDESLLFNWTGNLSQYASEVITLPTTNVSAGPHTFSASSSNPNGGADDVAVNNAVSASFYTVISGETITLNLDLDCYGTETSWTLTDNDDQLLYSGGGYTDISAGALVTEYFCLAEECYTFTLIDSYGDGLTGCGSGNGSYQILNSTSETLAELIETDANFGSEYIRQVCLGSSGIEAIDFSTITLFPNPASGLVNITSSDYSIDRIEIISLSGQIIQVKTVQATETTVSIGSLTSGVYFVKLYVNGGEKIVKLVKE